MIMRICVGVDAAKQTHWACAVDEGGRVVLDRAVENDPEAIDGFVAELRALGGELVIGLDVIKTQTVLPDAETVPMLFWALLASGQILMRKVDGWETLSQPLAPEAVDLAA